MNVRLEIMFESPTEEDVASLRSVAIGLTNDPQSVRVVARKDCFTTLVTIAAVTAGHASLMSANINSGLAATAIRID